MESDQINTNDETVKSISSSHGMPSNNKSNFQEMECYSKHVDENCAVEEQDANNLFKKLTEYKGDTELFEKLINEWNNQDINLQASENLLKQKVQKLEKREVEYKAKISDFEVTFDNMQSAIDSLHHELNLIDEMKKEIDDKKKTISSLESNLIAQKKQAEEKTVEHGQLTTKIHENHEEEIKTLQNEIFSKLQEKDKEIKDVIAMKNSEIEQLKKDKNAEIKTLIDNYEEKLSAAQEEKITALMDQQHRSNTNQELLRQKFEYSQRQYETEINCLQDQIRSMQKPLPLPGNRRSASNKQTVVAKPLFKKAKNFLRQT
ncbi:hypothetical protein ACF0H5_017203 [Mactra antiquata]